ncbi:MAG: T9SS type A sorting domain-containing protein [Ferruginibacter sp.]
MQHFASYHKQSGTQGSLLTKSFSKLFFLSCMLMMAMAPKMVSAQAGQLDPSFNSTDHGYPNSIGGANNDVRTIALQADGKAVIGGLFTTYNNLAAGHIVRLNVDGSQDGAFNDGGTGANGNIMKIVTQADGKFIVAGTFTTYNGVAANAIIRLNTDGSRDASFDAGAGPNAAINSVAVQADGKILVAGAFTNFNGAANYIVRLNANGTTDATFNSAGSEVTSIINAIAVQTDGKVVVGMNNNYNGITTDFLTRLNTNGTNDASFNVGGIGADNTVNAITIQPDGKILIGGMGMYNGSNSNLNRLNTNGSADASFTLPAYYTDAVQVVTLQADGKILVGFGSYANGYFDAEGGKIDRLNADGTDDNTFSHPIDVNVNEHVYAIQVQADQKLLIGNSLTSVHAAHEFLIAGSVLAGLKNLRINRYNTNGSEDAAYNFDVLSKGANRNVSAVAYQADGKVLVGGTFYAFNGEAVNYLIRLNTNGTRDASFNTGGSGPNCSVNAIVVQPDGKIVVAGLFSTYNNVPANHILRLNTNGTIDAGFNAPALVGTYPNDNYIYTLKLLPDGKILAGSNFGMIRINADGTTDSGFAVPFQTTHPYETPHVFSIDLQNDGKILIGGEFSRFSGTFRYAGAARLNADGSLDNTFNPWSPGVFIGTDDMVWAVAALPGGKTLISGAFTTYTTATTVTNVNHIARLNADGSIDPTFNVAGSGLTGYANHIIALPGGKVLIGGNFTNYNGIAVNGIARLNADGSLDNTFNTGGAGFNGVVNEMALENSSSKLIIVGDFTSYNATGKTRVARIYNEDAGAPFDCTVGNIAGPDRACQYITAGTNAVYQITAPTGSTITWTVSAASTMSIVSGQGTNQVSVHFANNFTAGAVYAHVVSATCSLNVNRSLTVKITVPSAPGAITASNSSICSVLGTPNTITYTIAKVSSATSYIWAAQAGTTTITHPNGAGVNDTTITVAFAAGFTNSAITVQSVNDCGTSSARSLNVTRNNPAMPAVISGPSYVCDYLLPSATTAAVYSVSPVAGLTYNWTVPAGASGLTGQGTNSISFLYPAGFTTGTVSVTATNGCGTSTARSLAVKASVAGTPGAITTTNISDCPNRQYTYSIAAIPVNATSVNWVVPAGGTIVSGQGTTSITVSYTSGAITGYVSVKASNTCGTSTVRKIAISLAACPPATPFAKGTENTVQAIAKSTLQIPALEGMDVKVFPNPSVNDFNLQVITSGKEAINVRVFDVAGRFISEHTMYANETAKLGAALKTGTYIVEVRQGNNVKTTRIIKF